MTSCHNRTDAAHAAETEQPMIRLTALVTQWLQDESLWRECTCGTAEPCQYAQNADRVAALVTRVLSLFTHWRQTAMHDAKYMIAGDAVINRATGTPIPADEPIFILRAQDIHATAALRAYHDAIKTGIQYDGREAHLAGVLAQLKHFHVFEDQHADRMRWPGFAERASIPTTPEPVDLAPRGVQPETAITDPGSERPYR